MVERFWRVLGWSDAVFEEFSGWFSGKTSPVHLFWHSFDLAVTRFGGDRAPDLPTADPVTREAYSHDLISFGFWAGDENVREASYYSYTAPEPAGLREHPLRPAAASWIEQGSGSLALLPYDAVRTAANPKATLLVFLESAYEAGADASGWDRAKSSRPGRRRRGRSNIRGGPMEDAQVHGTIEQLVREEHELWEREAAGTATEEDRRRLQELKVALDQCWDLLRQRRALREVGRDPADASVRSAEVVERYEQ
jgi:hypothetical protein